MKHYTSFSKVLILGASSFVGNNLIHGLRYDQYIGTYYNHKVKNCIKFNSIDDNLYDLEVDWSDISHAVILLGDTEPDSCYYNKAFSEQLNVKSIKRILDDLIQRDIHITFTSSEFVFDGKQGYYSESDVTNPILLYGKQKVEIENYIKKGTNEYCILRLAKIYGLDYTDNTLFTNWYRIIRSGCAELYCANDQYFSPVFVGDVTAAIKKVLKYNICGVYHLSCNLRYCRYELLETLMKYMDAPLFKIKPCSIDHFELPEKRPRDVSMLSRKFIDDAKFNFISPELACRRLVGK